MQTLTLTPTAGANRVVRCRLARVYIDGQRKRDLKVVSWEVMPAPTFGRARLTLHPSPLAATKRRIEDVSALPSVGTQLVIRPARGSCGGEFHGIISAHHLEVAEDRELLIAEAKHLLSALLSEKMTSRWQLADGEACEVKETRVKFNGSKEFLASSSVFEINGRLTRVFDSGVSAGTWTVADALAYLLAAAAPGELQTPSLDELKQLAGDIELGALDITGKSIAEALVEVAHRGGLELRGYREGLGLVFYRPGKQGRLSSVSLQKPGEPLSPSRSNLWRGRIKLSRRPSRRTVLALGQRKQYETTFDLKRGWDPSLETPRWRDFVRGKSGNWPRLADVYRKWVLNEHGWYSPSPWNVDRYEFSSIAAEDFRLHVPRRLLPCLSADIAGTSLGVVVEFRLHSEDNWRRWAQPFWVATDECAIYLGGDSLPAEFFQAGVEGTAEVRVTASIETDVRLAVEIPGDTAALCEVADFSSQAAWRKVHSNSIFYGDTSLGEPNERDDTDMLARLARRYSEICAKSFEAELTLGWVDTSYFVGDIIERIDGRALELQGNPDGKPFVRSVTHDFSEGQNTTLIVSG
ncbi:MAG: hypothetical protein ACYTF6_00080 [Planctomycetota bacterium]|jgi:hypothetical protein